MIKSYQQIKDTPAEERTPDEIRRLALAESIPAETRKILEDKVRQMAEQVMAIERERDAIIDYLNGFWDEGQNSCKTCRHSRSDDKTACTQCHRRNGKPTKYEASPSLVFAELGARLSENFDEGLVTAERDAVEAITAANAARANNVEEGKKRMWLAALECNLGRGFYSIDKNLRLEIRVTYLLMRICLEQSDLTSYNLYAGHFNRLLRERQ